MRPLLLACIAFCFAAGTVWADLPQKPFDVGTAKQLFVDHMLIARMHRLKQVVNRPQPTGEKLLGADKPWEYALNCFGDTVLQDGDIVRLYTTVWRQDKTPCLGYAVSHDGVHFEKPELGLYQFEGKPTNIIEPNQFAPESLQKYFFGTCVFIDTNPACPPEQRYKLITGDTQTWVFVSRDGVEFKPMFEKPSFRASDTANICFFDSRIGRYVAYMRGHSGGRAVVRCEFADLSDFGSEQLVFAADERDQQSIDRSRFVAMDFYNSAAIKYPYAENAYFMFPSAYYHFPEPPVGKRSNDGITWLQFAASHDGIHWTRHDREPYIALQPGQNQLYMASGLVRQNDTLYLYYGVYHGTHQDIDPTGYITRAALRLDGFVSVDAGEKEGRLFTVPVTFSGKRLELNVVGEEVKVGLLDQRGRPIRDFSLRECDTISGDYITRTVSWNGRSDIGKLAGKPVRLVFTLRNAKLYAFQFVR